MIYPNDKSINFLPYQPKQKSNLESIVAKYPNSFTCLTLAIVIKLNHIAIKFCRGQSSQNLTEKTTATFLAGIATAVAIKVIWKIKDLAYKATLEKKTIEFKNATQGLQPSFNASILIKSKTKTFNHILDFIIENSRVWCRPKGQREATWKPLFFEGEPKVISADGANLVVIDDANGVHYRKVLKEARGFEEINHPKIVKHIQKDSILDKRLGEVDQNVYVAVDKTDKSNWKERWYNFPVLCRIFNLFTGNQLILNSPNVVISHRCRYVNGHKDAAGKFHEANTGTTTLFELMPEGKSIRLHDPWVPTLANIQVALPKNFTALTIDASASTIMALGYKYDEDGISNLTVFTRLCDIDIEGHNPFLSYAYETEVEYADLDHVKTLPDLVENEGWREHPLPVNVEYFYKQITIIQTGVGNDARKMSIAAKKSGAYEIYSKKNLDNQWENLTVTELYIDKTTKLPKQLPKQQNKDNMIAVLKLYEYVNKSIPIYRDRSIIFDSNTAVARLYHKNDRYHTCISVGVNKKIYRLSLHKRLGLGTFLGIKHEHYYLVVPKSINDSSLFNGRKVIKVNLALHGVNVHLTW